MTCAWVPFRAVRSAGQSSREWEKPSGSELGTAIYNMPGLTFQGPLDAFWKDAAPPDAGLFRRYRNTVIWATQANGGYSSAVARSLAVESCLRLLMPQRSPLEELLGHTETELKPPINADQRR